MRQSRLFMINYLCMMLIAVTLFLHLANHAFLGVSNYKQSLEFAVVKEHYQAPATAILLTVLLVAVCYHSVFSFRTILLEWRHGRMWAKAVNRGAVIVAVIMVGFGFRTIVLMLLIG